VPLFVFVLDFFLWRFCAFLSKGKKGSSKTPQKAFGEVHVRASVLKKLREKKIQSHFPFDFFYRVFGRFYA
jgi:hypothetical protein